MNSIGIPDSSAVNSLYGVLILVVGVFKRSIVALRYFPGPKLSCELPCTLGRFEPSGTVGSKNATCVLVK